MVFRTFRWSFLVTLIGLALAFWYGSAEALVLAVILSILEISFSFDNAVINSTVLERMSPFWQKIFLTVGIAVAVFGMRLVFPLLIVTITASLNPVDVIRLAMEKGDPGTPGTYGYLLHEAHPSIAAFGGMFLLMIFLDFVFEEREITWLDWLEKPLARLGRLDQLSTVISLALLFVVAETLAGEDAGTVLGSGVLGIVTYLVVNGLGELFESQGQLGHHDEQRPEDLAGISGRSDEALPRGSGATAQVVLATGKAAFFLFLYLEVLDASFSFDGVIGAFAITSDPIIIAIGLGVGAMYIRSITVYLVRKGTLSDYVYLEHGAHWAIGALAVILLLTIEIEVPELVTGLLGVGFIAAAFASSVARNRREAREAPAEVEPAAGAATPRA